MGWWRLNCGTGGISCEVPRGKPEGIPLINAIPGRDAEEDFYGGDDPADIMDGALHEIVEVYKRDWGRPPAWEEILGVFRFCSRKYEKEIPPNPS